MQAYRLDIAMHLPPTLHCPRLTTLFGVARVEVVEVTCLAHLLAVKHLSDMGDFHHHSNILQQYCSSPSKDQSCQRTSNTDQILWTHCFTLSCKHALRTTHSACAGYVHTVQRQQQRKKSVISRERRRILTLKRCVCWGSFLGDFGQSHVSFAHFVLSEPSLVTGLPSGPGYEAIGSSASTLKSS